MADLLKSEYILSSTSDHGAVTRCSCRCTVEAVSELWCLRRSHSISASCGTAVKRSLNDGKVEGSRLVQVLIFILILFFNHINSDSKIFVLVLKRQIVD